MVPFVDFFSSSLFVLWLVNIPQIFVLLLYNFLLFVPLTESQALSWRGQVTQVWGQLWVICAFCSHVWFTEQGVVVSSHIWTSRKIERERQRTDTDIGVVKLTGFWNLLWLTTVGEQPDTRKQSSLGRQEWVIFDCQREVLFWPDVG